MLCQVSFKETEGMDFSSAHADVSVKFSRIPKFLFMHLFFIYICFCALSDHFVKTVCKQFMLNLKDTASFFVLCV